MANYTDQEVQDVVDSLVRASVRRPYDTLGVRRTDVTYSDLQESAAGVFLMYPKSPLYMAYLAGVQVHEVYENLSSDIDALQAALGVLRRHSMPVRDISSLINAKVALYELESLVQKKAPKDISLIPAYKRMNSNLDRFLGAVGNNVKNNGAIVQTPEEARLVLPTLVSNLQASTTEYLRRVALLATAMVDYNSLNLGQLLSKTIIQNARVKLQARADELEAMAEPARLEVLRSTVLDILGVKAVVLGFGSFPGLSSTTSLTGTVAAYVDSGKPAIPAAASLPVTGTLAMVIGQDVASSTNVLKVWVEGAPTGGTPSATLYLAESYWPRIEGTTPGGYIISTPLAVMPNYQLRFLFDGVTPLLVTLTSGVRTTAQVVSDLSGALVGNGFTAESYFMPLKYQSQVTVVPGGVGGTISLALGEMPLDSVLPLDEVDFYFGPNAVTTRTVLVVTSTGTGIASFIVDGAPLLASTTDHINVGDPYQRCIRILPTDKTAAINARRTIQLAPTSQVHTETAATLGMYNEAYSRGQPSDVAAAAAQVQQLTTVAECVVEQVAVYSGLITTDASDSTLLHSSAIGLAEGMSVVISEGVNAGRYFIDSLGLVAGDFHLRDLLPMARDGYNQPLTVQAYIGFDGWVMKSRDVTAASSVAFTAPDAAGSVTGPVGPVTGTTTFVKFSSGYVPSVGDKLELYTTDKTIPSSTFIIEEVFTGGVCRLDVAVGVTSSWSLTDSTLPYVRLVVGHVSDFEVLSTTLTAQLQQSDANPTRFFRDLNRLINPLTVNKNPTHSEIGSAEARVQDLVYVLDPMDTAIVAYNPEHVPQMDELVKVFKEKGADRAMDLLLQCEFSTFFGLTQEETSYAGAFQKAVRDVARNDLPIHKSNRLARTLSPLRSSADSVDHEYSDSDLDTSPIVDPPVTID
jgi:hypothetical protein